MTSLQGVLWAAGFCIAGCGGKAVIDGWNGAGGEGGSSTTTASTTTTTGTGGASSCPEPFPALGAPCYTPQLTCALELACCGAHGLCWNGTWINAGPYCSEDCATFCGSSLFGCLDGALCVIESTGSTVVGYRCAANPCSGPPSCDCAAAVCQANNHVCTSVSNTTVSCASP
jgi:hypothetical protein